MPLAKPSRGIEELVDVNSGREIIATPVVVDRFEDLMKKYDAFLSIPITFQETIREYMSTVNDVLTPSEIDSFLHHTTLREEHGRYTELTGYFVSRLIQCSYDTGNRVFYVDTHSLKLFHDMGARVVGNIDRKLELTIHGEIGDMCGENTQNANIVVGTTGNFLGSHAYNSTFKGRTAGDKCGFKTKNCTFTIEEVGHGCGFKVQQSTFTIGTAGNLCGLESKHSTFTIEKAGEYCGWASMHSTFNTHSPEQYKRFKESVPQDKDNKLYLLSNTGSIIKGGEW